MQTPSKLEFDLIGKGSFDADPIFGPNNINPTLIFSIIFLNLQNPYGSTQ